jgi:small subunit ribosomal protein S21
VQGFCQLAAMVPIGRHISDIDLLTAGPSASGLCIPASQRPGRLGHRSHQSLDRRGTPSAGPCPLQHVDQALKVLKKTMQREGVFREMKLRGHYEKPSERRVREKAEAIRRARRLARKKLRREGLLPMKPRPVPGALGRGGPARAPRF